MEKSRQKIARKSPIPDTIENIAIGEHSDIQIWRENGVEPPDLLVPEEGVGHPDLAGVRHCEIFDLP